MLSISPWVILYEKLRVTMEAHLETIIMMIAENISDK